VTETGRSGRTGRETAPGVAFRAQELRADASLAPVSLAFGGSPGAGWMVERNGAAHLALGPGYRLLRSVCCGVCSTDLDRPHLPFPLPQVVGHEVVARDDAGRRCVIEINASHAARGEETGCPFCHAGLASHCPERRVLGIHDLPGGFGAHVLAPAGAVIPLPDAIPDAVAVLVEPFAAALHAVDRIAPRAGDRVAVLGPRRLGLLVLAALAARRRASGARFDIEAWARRASLREHALRVGADVASAPPDPASGPHADVVVDTTGSPEGLALALPLAGRETHLKSTHGQPSGGIAHTTALVVDEIALERGPADDAAPWPGVETPPHADRSTRPLVGWLAAAAPPAALAAHCEIVRAPDPAALLARVEHRDDRLPRADVVVVDDPASLDAAIRPVANREISPVRPRGTIALHARWRGGAETQPIADAVVRRGLRLSTSRCGDFREAVGLLAADATLRDALAPLVTHRLPAERLAEALRLARSPEAVKVVVEHPAAEAGEG